MPANNYNSYRFNQKFAFILSLSFLTNQKQESGFQQVGDLVTRNIPVFFLQRVALFFKAIPNSIYFFKGIFLHVIPVCIIVPCNQRTNIFAVMSYEIIQFFKTSHKESIYHTFTHEILIYSFTIYVCRQDVVLLNRLLKASYEIALFIRQKDGYVHLRNPCHHYHKENEQDAIVSINYKFQMRLTIHVCSLTKRILKT